MTKAELAKLMGEKLGKTANQMVPVVETFMEAIQETICSGEQIFLRGFGTFQIVRRAPKPARIITKGKPIIVPAHNIVKFKPVKSFKKKLARMVPAKK